MKSPMSIVHYSKSVIVQTCKARLRDKLTGKNTYFATQNEVICINLPANNLNLLNMYKSFLYHLSDYDQWFPCVSIGQYD